jgi:hypothetical protein
MNIVSHFYLNKLPQQLATFAATVKGVAATVFAFAAPIRLLHT